MCQTCCVQLHHHISNHIRYSIFISTVTIVFHQVTTMPKLVEFLTIRKRRRFESISISWEFIPNTNPGRPDQRSPYVTFGTTHVQSRVGPTPHTQGYYGSQVAQAMPAHGRRQFAQVMVAHCLWIRSPQCAHFNGTCTWLELSYSALRSEQFIWPAKWEACVQSRQKFRQWYGP
jgi:hypothetical protein